MPKDPIEFNKKLADIRQGETTGHAKFSNMGLKNEDIIQIVQVLKENSSISSLDLSYNYIGDEGILSLVKDLSLSSLNLSYNPPEDNIMAPIFRAEAEDAFGVEYSDDEEIAKKEVTKKGISALASNKTITKLGLRDKIKQSLFSGKKTAFLDDDSDDKEIARKEVTRKKITRIGISALASSKTITKLNLLGIVIRKEDAREFHENKILCELLVDYLPEDQEESKALINDMINRNRTDKGLPPIVPTPDYGNKSSAESVQKNSFQVKDPYEVRQIIKQHNYPEELQSSEENLTQLIAHKKIGPPVPPKPSVNVSLSSKRPSGGKVHQRAQQLENRNVVKTSLQENIQGKSSQEVQQLKAEAQPVQIFPIVPFSVPARKDAPAKKISYAIRHEDLQVNTADPGHFLGQGGFGQVYKGHYQLAPVAVKQLLISSLSERLLKEFKQEAEMMSRLDHPHIVHFYGRTESSPYRLVMELMSQGSLYKVLHNHVEISWQQRQQWAMEVGSGLYYLHSHTPQILHRDLKSLNVLVGEDNKSKLTDFGLAMMNLRSTTKTLTKQDAKAEKGEKAVGSIRWMAPELLATLRPKYSIASDVYAFAIVMWELAAQELPYKDVSSDSTIEACVKGGEREIIPAVCPAFFAKLITQSWSQKPEDRPHVKDVVSQLQSAQEGKAQAPAFSAAAAMSASRGYASNSNDASARASSSNFFTKGYQ